MKRFSIQKWKNLQKKIIKIWFFLILFSCTNILIAQKKIKIKESHGTAFISGDVSPNEAKKRALFNAKINALKSAGIVESIKSFETLFTSEFNNDYQQFYSSTIQDEIQGNILNYEIIQDTIVRKNELEFYAKVTINALVIEYKTKPDVTFDANIEGIKAVYDNGELLKFNLKSSQAFYLTIFNINDVDASVFFPNSREVSRRLSPFDYHEFPLDVQTEYALVTSEDQEMNRLIFVFTKTYIPFIKLDEDGLTNEDQIFSWIYSIMPDQRNVQYYSFTIRG